MSKKAPNKLFAPVVIAGITIGFLASAYKFIFASPKRSELEQQDEPLQHGDEISEIERENKA